MQKALKMALCGALLLTALFSLSAFTSVPSALAATLSMNPHATPAGATTHVVTDTTMSPALSCPATIARGSSNYTLVRLLQQDLKRDYSYGYFKNSPYNFSPPLAVDGSFGTKTYNAVRDFQKAWGLPVDGIVGPMTWNALEECL